MNLKHARIVYLTANDIYTINEEVTGTLPCVRDRQLLHSAVRRPRLVLFGEAQFPTLHDKAAALLESLAYHHPFADGNKRTALRAVTRFFEQNGWRVTWTANEEYAFFLQVAQGQTPLSEIVAWLRAHTQEQQP